MREGAREAARDALSKGYEPISLINSEIVPALNEVGCEFEGGRAYLPELLSSAEAARDAFEVIKEKIPKVASGGRKVILATVKGDIHDIGKNIVKVLLESYGFSVSDLGRDVPPERILSAARDGGCSLIGLSALMTTTVPAMQSTVALIHKELPEARVMVGGAVLTAEYAEMIGADFYGKDAMDAVRIAERHFGDAD
jgi:5-methyltetrahydrofolate--homocysteine methyltransferase